MINIFILDKCPKLSCEYYMDSHVVKIILEIAQIIFNVRNVLSIQNKNFPCYRPRHTYHMLNDWGSYSFENYSYLIEYVIALHEEFIYRFGKTHKSAVLIQDIYKNELDLISNFFHHRGFLLPIQYMPLIYQESEEKYDLAYRKFYFFHKRFFMNKVLWTKRKTPYWFNYQFFKEENVFL